MNGRVSAFGGYRGEMICPVGQVDQPWFQRVMGVPKKGRPHYRKKKKKGQRWFSLGHQGFSGEVLTNFTQNGKGLYLLKWLLQRPICLIFLSQGSIIAGNEAFKINNLRTESIFPMLGSSRGNASESSSPGPLQGGASAEGVAIMEWWGRRSHDLGSVLAVPVKCAWPGSSH